MRTGVIYKVSIGPNYIIGSTLNEVERRNTYLRNLRKNIWNNDYVQNSFNKYGEKSFKFEVIKRNIPEEELEFIEDVYMAICKSRVEYRLGGMNLRNASRVKFSKEIREKMSKAATGKILSIEAKNKLREFKKNFIVSDITKNKLSKLAKQRIISENTRIAQRNKIIKPVYQYNKDTGEFIKKWNSQSEVIKYYSNGKNGTISNVVNEKGECKIAYGYIWKNKRVDKIYNLNSYKHKRHSPIMQKTISGIFIAKWNTISEAEKALNIKNSSANISACCRGKKNSAYGFKWEYIKNPK